GTRGGALGGAKLFVPSVSGHPGTDPIGPAPVIDPPVPVPTTPATSPGRPGQTPAQPAGGPRPASSIPPATQLPSGNAPRPVPPSSVRGGSQQQSLLLALAMNYALSNSSKALPASTHTASNRVHAATNAP